MTKEELWKATLGEIELNLSKANFITWFKNTGIIAKKEGIITINVPNAFTKEWLENKYNKFIFKALKNLSPDVKKIEYLVSQQNALDSKTAFKEGDDFDLCREDQLSFNVSRVNRETNLNPRYTFDSFVVGGSNELAYAAAWSITKRPGTTYNPLFLYGGVGLGKTHLLQAIGNAIAKRSPKRKIKYVPSEKFINELVTAIRSKKTDEFKNKYRKIDVLIIDDIQFLAGKEKTQEEFFHTFNDLYEKNKQIVLSSDRQPRSIPTLEERLRSRFEGGMIADIGYPDLETRIAILKAKAAERKINLTDETYTYIAENIQKNIRELEGALNRINASVNLDNLNEVSLDQIKNILNSIIANNYKVTNYKKILKAVSEFYDINEKDLINKNRKKEIVNARQIAMHLMREELKSSYPFIGTKLGGRDHTTAIHACEKIERERKTNDVINEEINLIKEKIYNS